MNNNIQGGNIRYYYLGSHEGKISAAFDFEGGYAVYVYRDNGEMRLNTIFGAGWEGINKYKQIDVAK